MKPARFPKFRRLALPTLALAALCYGGFWWWKAHAAGSDIEAGKLGFTSRWGWVNWGHAIPDAPRRLLADIREARPNAAGRITVSLRQAMTGNYGPLRATAGLTRVYRADAPRSKAEETALAWALLRDLTEAFEEMQGSLPNSLDPSSWRSSWREGDLAGNRLSFFAALHGLELARMRELAGAMTAEASQARWKGGKNRSWGRAEELGETALPDGRDPWDEAWEKGAPAWELFSENREYLEVDWR